MICSRWGWSGCSKPSPGSTSTAELVFRRARSPLWSARSSVISETAFGQCAYPVPSKALATRLPQETARLTNLLGRAPTISELADALNSDEEAVLEAADAWYAYSPTSLSARTADEDDQTDLIDRLGEEEDGYERAEDWATLQAGIAVLDVREWQIIFLSLLPAA
jgi:sigma-70-like protein